MKLTYATFDRPVPFVVTCAVMLAIMLAQVLLTYLPQTWLPVYFQWDAMGLMRGRSALAFVPSEPGQFFYASNFFDLIGEQKLTLIIALLGVLVFGLVFSVQRTLSGLAIAVLIAIAPMILFMIRPSKEFFVMLLTLVALSVLCLRLPGGLRVMLVAGLYCVYAYYFRIYYYLIALGFVCLAVFVFLPRSWRPAAIVVALLTLVLVPDSIFMATQGTRDAVNELRYATGDIGSRTAFINLLEPTNEISFIINYIYSIVRLNLAILFNLNLKELFLTVNVFVYAWLLYRGLHMNRTARLAALLLLAHFMVLWLFEPDLGSYFRHLSSALVLLVPIMRRVEIDKVACLRKA